MPRTRAGQGKQAKPNGVGTLATFDLGAHRLAGRFDVSIVDPRGAPTPVVVTLCSRYSREYRQRAVEVARQRMTEEGSADTPEVQADAFILDLMVTLTADWRGVVVDGEALACSPENVRALYTSDGLGWLYDQVAEAYFARERFFVRPGSAS